KLTGGLPATAVHTLAHPITSTIPGMTTTTDLITVMQGSTDLSISHHGGSGDISDYASITTSLPSTCIGAARFMPIADFFMDHIGQDVTIALIGTVMDTIMEATMIMMISNLPTVPERIGPEVSVPAG